MQIRFAIEIIKGDTEINRFLEDKDNKLLYASSEYSRPVLTISILTEKEMIEEDKILLNNIIKSKFIHCVDHEKTLSDVQIIYLSRYDVFLPRFGAKTCPQSNDSQHKESHRTEGKYSLSCANTHTHLMLEKNHGLLVGVHLRKDEPFSSASAMMRLAVAPMRHSRPTSSQ